MLERFYAVAKFSSTRFIFEIAKPNGKFSVKRIASNIKLGIGVELRIAENCRSLYSTEWVEIGKKIIFYKKCVDNSCNKLHCQSTPPVVALFLTESDAVNCFEALGIEKADSRWKKQTKFVLEEIATNNYPGLAISTDSNAY